MNDSSRVVIYTDGACEPNPGSGGWGWHRSDGEQRCGGEAGTTNNRMELTAILDALRSMPDRSAPLVYSDSQYCVKGLTEWRAGWQKKDWMKKKDEPMPNRDLWLALEAEIVRVQPLMRWVRGHNGDDGNELADRLADQGRTEAMRGQALPVTAAPEPLPIIPVMPTESMMLAGMAASRLGRPVEDNAEYVLSIWRAMIEARPAG